MHRRLMVALARAARAQRHSRALIEAHDAIHDELEAAASVARDLRARRRAPPQGAQGFAIGQDDAQERFPSG